MENIKKDLATSLTSLIFVVISLAGVVTVLSNSPSDDIHPKFENYKSAMKNSIEKPFIILGNNITLVKETETKENILG